MSGNLVAVRREWLESPAFGSANGGLTVTALLLMAVAGGTLAGGGSWLLFGVMIGVALLLVAAVARRCFKAVSATSPAETLSVLMDPKFFMPYCICPECKVEGLHWLKSSAVPRDRDGLLKYYREVETHNSSPLWFLQMDYDSDTRIFMAEQWAAEREAQSDVIRECRDCGHTWGQKVGLELAS